MAKAQVMVPLDIADVRVLQTEINERGELIITIESTKVGTQCRRCGRHITKAHGQDEWVTVTAPAGVRAADVSALPAEALSMFGLRRAADDQPDTGMAGFE